MSALVVGGNGSQFSFTTEPGYQKKNRTARIAMTAKKLESL